MRLNSLSFKWERFDSHSRLFSASSNEWSLLVDTFFFQRDVLPGFYHRNSMDEFSAGLSYQERSLVADQAFLIDYSNVLSSTNNVSTPSHVSNIA